MKLAKILLVGGCFHCINTRRKVLGRKTFLVGLIVGIYDMMTSSFAEDKPGKEKEKCELSKLYEEIDKHYKAVEELSGYYEYNNSDWNVIFKSSDSIVKLSKIIIRKFSRPDDQKYEELNKSMLAEAEKMNEVAKHKDEQGALEDTQWHVRKLKQTCAVCHKHLGVQGYQ